MGLTPLGVHLAMNNGDISRAVHAQNLERNLERRRKERQQREAEVASQNAERRREERQQRKECQQREAAAQPKEMAAPTLPAPAAMTQPRAASSGILLL